MKVCIISDTHNRHWDIKLPDADVLIHCGDITLNGEINELLDFSVWLKDLPFKYKLILAGNHDWCFDNDYKYKSVRMIEDAGGIYLQDSSYEIEDKLFYGSPWTPYFGGFAFNLRRGWPIAQQWDKIPNKTNILITHGPPYGILDKTIQDGNQGCKDLLKRVKQLPDLKIHCYGHLHSSGSKYRILREVKYINASICDEKYEPSNRPVITEL